MLLLYYETIVNFANTSFGNILPFLLFIVAAWYAELWTHIVYRFLSVMSVGHAFSEINEVWQQISRRQVVRRGRNLAHS